MIFITEKPADKYKIDIIVKGVVRDTKVIEDGKKKYFISNKRPYSIRVKDKQGEGECYFKRFLPLYPYNKIILFLSMILIAIIAMLSCKISFNF
ncbi:hypothetical protein KKB18_07470 [bacterium]|nr:hypothetical protein [bacterium]